MENNNQDLVYTLSEFYNRLCILERSLVSNINLNLLFSNLVTVATDITNKT